MTRKRSAKKRKKAPRPEPPDGVKLTPFDPGLAGQMDVVERVMRKRRVLLNKLAK